MKSPLWDGGWAPSGGECSHGQIRVYQSRLFSGIRTFTLSVLSRQLHRGVRLKRYTPDLAWTRALTYSYRKHVFTDGLSRDDPPLFCREENS